MVRIREGNKKRQRKRDIKPTIEIELKSAIYRLSYITNTPVKDLAERMCMYGINNKIILETLSEHFIRDIRFGTTIYRGDTSNPKINKKKAASAYERISLKVEPHVHDSLAALSYALDCSVSFVCAQLIHLAFHDFDFVNNHVKKYIEKNLDANRMNELKMVLKYINKTTHETNTWATLLSHIIDEVKEPITNVKGAVDEFIINHWRKQV